MKVKNLFSILAMVFTMLFIVGCSNSPKGALENWSEALLDGDAEKAKKYCAYEQSFEEEIEEMAMEFGHGGEAKRLEFKAIIKNMLEKGDVSYDGKDAFIFYNGEYTPFKKVNGKWKVNFE